MQGKESKRAVLVNILVSHLLLLLRQRAKDAREEAGITRVSRLTGRRLGCAAVVVIVIAGNAGTSWVAASVGCCVVVLLDCQIRVT